MPHLPITTYRLPRTGFTIPEVLVAVFILAILTIAIISLATLGTKTAFESERQTVALGLVNQSVERIRALEYTSVGYSTPSAGEPDGVLVKVENRLQNNQTYTITTAVNLVDDPFNGTVVTVTESNADYKKVSITATWQLPSNLQRDVTVVTYVAKGALASVLPPVPSSTPTPTPSSLPSPTSTPTVSPTLTPTPSPSPTASLVPSPTPTPGVQPIVDLKANGSDGPVVVPSNTAATLSWTSVNATTCTASTTPTGVGSWSGSKSTSGSQSTGPLTSTTTFILSCTGPGGAAADSVQVNVGVAP